MFIVDLFTYLYLSIYLYIYTSLYMHTYASIFICMLHWWFGSVVGAAVPAAVCCWGLCSCCSGVGRCLSGVYISSSLRG